MKRAISFLMIIFLFISLSACSGESSNFQSPASFYYCASTITYNSPESVIATEIRETASYANDLSAILNHYLQGPHSTLLYSPFPAGSSVVRLSQAGTEITVVMSEPFATLTGIDLSLACACLGKTLFSLSDAQSITIQARSNNLDGNRFITLTRDSILLIDEIVTNSAND